MGSVRVLGGVVVGWRARYRKRHNLKTKTKTETKKTGVGIMMGLMVTSYVGVG